MCTVIAGATISALAGYGGATAAGMEGAALVGATAMGAASGAKAGADYQAAEYSQKLAEQNVDILESQAESERIAGSQEAQKKTIETRQQTSRAAVELAGRGLDISSGTAEDLLAQNQEVGQLESMTILNNANRRAFGYESQAQNISSQAELQKRRASSGMFTSVLGSAARPTMIGRI
ncbi:hypothetical protein ACU63D_000325 [Vibrio parahaemolyticus]|uniref:hypothetical protein n=1 Tax=Vibrio parahaemolyticus TaxID=670 RepID=UPI000B5176EC|nr:hypothetical protein [Vibrio parahaemolyticus]EGQ8036340.1 hypothetical protein [Vibrio parahaemolyticus]EGQ8511704.1 hypothetical protein [Vibrio parahaemolyticus]EGR2971214.1 hypothetical protein [Vibrio parahaemolyticus]EGR3062215.1 hypothetical protein [Vibrio parahaemolyticus]EGR3071861.1 hypothetical protein [Vibrio parahaemolyticus]